MSCGDKNCKWCHRCGIEFVRPALEYYAKLLDSNRKHKHEC